MMDDASENNSFSHSFASGNAQFHSRVNSVFASLGDLEKKHEESLPTDDAFAESESQSESVIDQSHLVIGSKPKVKEESPFAHRHSGVEISQCQRTNRNRRRPANVPDHVLHPKKWKKYSLEDDGSSKYGKMDGNALNKQVALSFLDDLKKRKILKEPQTTLDVDSDCVNEKHRFNKSKPIDVDDEVRPTNASSINVLECVSSTSGSMVTNDAEVVNFGGQTRKVHIMDTYEFGQHKPNSNAKNDSPSSSKQKDKLKNNELSLGHLMEEENKVDITDLGLNKQSNDPIVNKNTESFKKTTRKRGLRKRCTSNDDEEEEVDD